MGNNYSKDWQEALTRVQGRNRLQEEERVEIWEMLMKDYVRMTRNLGHEFHAQSSKIDSMLEAHFQKMEEGIMNKIKLWADHETNFLEIQKNIVKQTSDEIINWNASLLNWGNYLDKIRSTKNKRSRRNSIDDILDDIHTDSYLNITNSKPTMYKCDTMPAKVTKSTYNYEITAGTGCFIIIITILIVLLKKVQKLSKDIESKFSFYKNMRNIFANIITTTKIINSNSFILYSRYVTKKWKLETR